MLQFIHAHFLPPQINDAICMFFHTCAIQSSFPSLHTALSFENNIAVYIGCFPWLYIMLGAHCTSPAVETRSWSTHLA